MKKIISSGQIESKNEVRITLVIVRALGPENVNCKLKGAGFPT